MLWFATSLRPVLPHFPPFSPVRATPLEPVAQPVGHPAIERVKPFFRDDASVYQSPGSVDVSCHFVSSNKPVAVFLVVSYNADLRHRNLRYARRDTGREKHVTDHRNRSDRIYRKTHENRGNARKENTSCSPSTRPRAHPSKYATTNPSTPCLPNASSAPAKTP